MQVSIHSLGHERLPRRLPNGYKGAVVIVHLIREARERAGLTRAELARRTGVAASTVGRIEAGTRAPSTDLAERLVRAAGFEIRVALGEPDPATDALFERTLRRTPAERLDVYAPEAPIDTPIGDLSGFVTMHESFTMP